MRTALPVRSYAVAGGRVPVPEGRREPLPPAGARPRGARLPDLAVALARRALEGFPPPEACSVQFATALGCLTETGSFVENMIVAAEEAPRPRAFSASVHNAIASRLAIALSARGPCRTFTHGEVSFVHACLAAALDRARGWTAATVVGALDEWTSRAAQVCAACTATEEGGALLLLGEGPGAMAVVRTVAVARRPQRAWLPRLLEEEEADVVLLALPAGREEVGRSLATPLVPCRPLVGDHPSACAAAAALATAVLGGEVPPGALGLDRSPRSIAVLAGSRWGDMGLLVLGRQA